MKKLSKSILSALLALVILCSPLAGPVMAHASDPVLEISLDGLQNFAMAAEVVEIMNEERAANGLSALTVDPVIMDYAMQRAAEAYLYFSHTRPDNTDWYTVFGDAYYYGTKGENIAIGQDSAQWVMDAWMNSEGHRANILNGNFNSVGIGCFYQPDGSIAWVQLFYSGTCQETETRTDIKQVYDVKVSAKASNLVGKVSHYTFSNAYCAAYLYEGSTVGTSFCLMNPVATWQKIYINAENVKYVTSDSNVFTANNDDHTITATGVGVAGLGVQIDGWDIYMMDDAGYINTTSTVEVLEKPALHYSVDDRGNILVDYSEFNSSLTLYFKGEGDEMWFMGNWERDCVYTHYDPDPTETYVYVMRYYDPYLETFVEIGDRLVVKLSDEEPDVCTHQNVTTIPGEEPTCTEEGLTEGKVCADCGQVIQEQQILSALDHDWSQWEETQAPTEETPGLEERCCQRCGQTESRQTDPLEHVHSYDSQEIHEATCTEDGYIVYTCRCGDSYTETLPAQGHRYVDGACEHCGAPEALLGDVNGDGRVNARDARALLRFIAGLAQEGEVDETAADFNGDGRVNARDARAILRHIAGLE